MPVYSDQQWSNIAMQRMPKFKQSTNQGAKGWAIKRSYKYADDVDEKYWLLNLGTAS